MGSTQGDRNEMIPPPKAVSTYRLRVASEVAPSTAKEPILAGPDGTGPVAPSRRGRQPAGVASVITLNAAPCGSVSTAKRPGGMSIGSLRTCAPRPLASATVASASATAKYTNQLGGIPSIGGFVPPATGAPPSRNSV